MTTTATITGTEIVIADRNDAGLLCDVVGIEKRPATFKLADEFLAVHKLGRTADWELDADGNVSALVTEVDNEFNGVRAARLWEKVGTTHDQFDMVPARTVVNGDLISDGEMCAPYLVAASSLESDQMKLHMVAESKNWNDRYTYRFSADQLVNVARKR